MEVEEAVDTARQASQACLTSEQLSDFNNRYHHWVEQGLQAHPSPERPEDRPKKRGRIKQSPDKNFLDEFSIHKEYVLTFMYEFLVSFDNNQAERNIRTMKVKQKYPVVFVLLKTPIFSARSVATFQLPARMGSKSWKYCG